MVLEAIERRMPSDNVEVWALGIQRNDGPDTVFTGTQRRLRTFAVSGATVKGDVCCYVWFLGTVLGYSTMSEK